MASITINPTYNQSSINITGEENLQTIKDSIEAIKLAIIDKGGTISGGITTYAEAIEALVLGESLPTGVVLSDGPNENNAKIYNYFRLLSVKNLLITSSDTCLITISRDSIKIIDNVERVGNLLEDGSITFKPVLS